MNHVIKEYYEKSGVKSFIIEDKLCKFEEHKDIANEFEFWILNHEFQNELHIEGYTASDIAIMSPYLNGEGAFLLLIELRENPVGAKNRIKSGFKIR